MQIDRIVFSPFEVNTYILSDTTGECIIIDPACNTEKEEDQLKKFIEDRGLKPVKLLNTHCHLDHVFGNKFVCDTYKLDTIASEEEVYNIKHAHEAAKLYGVDMYKPYPIKEFISEGDKITFGSSELDVMHVPGHTAGSLVFFNSKEKIAVSGDVLFNGSIGRTDLPGGDYNTLITQIKTKLFNLNDATMIYPGHGPFTTIQKEKESNPFFSDTYV
jgi:glyoxylase-like metal-dependent hydrolase (beta-lactamase superfamily II)